MGRSLAGLAVAAFMCGGSAAAAQDADLAEVAAPDVPVCRQALGAVRIVDGERAGWADLDLPAPSALMRAIVLRSRCFTVNDAAGAAGYVLVAELVGQNEPAQGSVTTFVGSIVDSRWNGLVRDASTPREGPQAVLTLMQVGSASRAAETRARAFAQDPNWREGASLRLGAAGRAWEENEIGRQTSAAYIDAYAQLVTQLGGLDSAAPGSTAALRTRRGANLRAGPSTSDALIARLAAGAELTTTGSATGDWVQVIDADGVEGWIHRDLVEAAR